jgi:hypothetical protein
MTPITIADAARATVYRWPSTPVSVAELTLSDTSDRVEESPLVVFSREREQSATSPPAAFGFSANSTQEASSTPTTSISLDDTVATPTPLVSGTFEENVVDTPPSRPEWPYVAFIGVVTIGLLAVLIRPRNET